MRLVGLKKKNGKKKAASETDVVRMEKATGVKYRQEKATPDTLSYWKSDLRDSWCAWSDLKCDFRN